MWIDVLCTPTEIPIAFHDTIGAPCAVIDVVRATSTLIVLGEQRARMVAIVASPAEARAYAALHPGFLLAGEIGGRMPPDFDLGNSPHQMATSPVIGRDVVLSTTNGTRTLVAAQRAGAGLIAIAGLRNATATARQLLQAGRDTTALIICSGRDQRLALDDFYTAGVLVREAASLASAQQLTLQLTESALLARDYADAHEPYDALRRSNSGQSVLRVGLEEDLAYCAELNATELVPQVRMAPDGSLLVHYPHTVAE